MSDDHFDISYACRDHIILLNILVFLSYTTYVCGTVRIHRKGKEDLDMCMYQIFPVIRSCSEKGDNH